MSANPAPGFKRRPDYPLATRSVRARVQARFDRAVIADTADALEMKEGDCPPVYYFPRRDVAMDRLVRSAHRTHCPFKGDASYYSLRDGPENAAWSYEAPYDEMSAIRERLAFYSNIVETTVLA